MKFCLFPLLLLLPLAHATAAEESPLPPVQALVTYFSQEVTPDGLTRQNTYKERWIRDGDTLWSERLIPLPVARAFHLQHDTAKTPHKHFMYQMAARWVTRLPDGNLNLDYVDHYHKNQVHYPPIEYSQSGFEPDWARLTRLFPAETLAQMQAEPEAALPEGLPPEAQDASWYRLAQDNQILRVLWSPELQLALAIERHTLDGYKQYRMQVTLKPGLPTPRPWQQLDGYNQKEISDFFD